MANSTFTHDRLKTRENASHPDIQDRRRHQFWTVNSDRFHVSGYDPTEDPTHGPARSQKFVRKSSSAKWEIKKL